MNTIDGNNGSIPVVSAKNTDRKKKKTMEYWIIAVAAVLIIAVIIAAAAVRVKKNKPQDTDVSINESAGDLTVPENEHVPVTFTEDVEVTFEGINGELEDAITEHSMYYSTQAAVKPDVTTKLSGTTAPKTTAPKMTTTEHLEKTTVVTNEDAQENDEVLDTISSFLSGTYYFDGDMITNGEKSPMEIAMNGSDFQVYSELDGKDISIMQLDSKTYMLNPATKKYAELTASFQKMIGIDASEMKFEFNANGFDPKKPTSVKKATYNGSPAKCYTYRNDSSHLEFIASETEILQLTMFDKNGTAKTVLIADEFTGKIPDEMLNFKGYSKTNMISFISSLM